MLITGQASRCGEDAVEARIAGTHDSAVQHFERRQQWGQHQAGSKRMRAVMARPVAPDC